MTSVKIIIVISMLNDLDKNNEVLNSQTNNLARIESHCFLTFGLTIRAKLFV